VAWKRNLLPSTATDISILQIVVAENVAGFLFDNIAVCEAVIDDAAVIVIPLFRASAG